MVKVQSQSTIQSGDGYENGGKDNPLIANRYAKLGERWQGSNNQGQR
jgi:hypothetical protein